MIQLPIKLPVIHIAEKEYEDKIKNKLEKQDLIKLHINPPTEFDFDIGEVVTYILAIIKYNQTTEGLDDLIDYCIYYALTKYDDVFYYYFSYEQLEIARAEIKKRLNDKLNLNI